MNRRGFLGMLLSAPLAPMLADHVADVTWTDRWYLPYKFPRHTYIWSEYGLGFELTEEALQDDSHPQLAEAAKYLAFSARHIEEQHARELFR